MKFSVAALILSVSAYAQLTITEPSSDHWWVAQSENTIKWTGSSPATFSVFLANSNTQLLTSDLALISVQPVYEYSKSFTPGSNVQAGTGYTLKFTDTLNSSNVYATSQTFEVKAKGSTYPAQSTASSGPGGSSSSASGTTSANPSSTSSASASTSSRGAALPKSQVGMGAGALLGGALAVAALF